MDSLTIAGETLRSRLLLGTAGYPNQQVLIDAVEASGCEIVTLSIRRISLAGHGADTVNLLSGYRFLPNTAGCETARDAVLTAELAREALGTDWIKLEIIGDRETLYPDVQELVTATPRRPGSTPSAAHSSARFAASQSRSSPLTLILIQVS